MKGIWKKKVPHVFRLSILGILGLLLLFSAISTYAAYQTPPTQTVTSPLLHYNQIGRFDYIVSLKNNTIYNTTTLGSGMGTYFARLVKHINASFSYGFQIDADATISGEYTLQAIIQTDLWTKTFLIASTTAFSNHGKTANFSRDFPLEYAFYEQSLQTINDEIGIIAQNPHLLIQCTVTLHASTVTANMSSSFSSTLNMTLGQKTIEVSKNLTTTASGSVTDRKTVPREDITTQRTSWSVLTIIFLVVFCIVALGTKSSYNEDIPLDVLVKKILKKYRDFIVEVNTKPNVILSQVIMVTSFDDLVKIAEESGKPIFHYSSIQGEGTTHVFYVLDEPIFYQCEFKIENKITNHIVDKKAKKMLFK